MNENEYGQTPVESEDTAIDQTVENSSPDAAENTAIRPETAEPEFIQTERPEAAEGERRPLLTMREEPPKALFSPAVKREIREWAVSLAVALVVVLIVRLFLFTVIKVEGPSMKNTLHNGDRLIVTILDMKIRGPQRYDVVICKFPNSTDRYVKRIVGMPGDTVEIRGGITYINGEPTEEPFVDNPTLADFGPQAVPEGEYLVMGDNRADSHDSRYADVGTLSRDMIIGKVRLVMWPLSRVHVVN